MLKRGTLLNLTDFYLFLQHFEVWIPQWRATSPILHIKVSSHVTTGAARFVETVLLCLQWVRRSSHKSVNTAKQCCISSDEETTHVLCSYKVSYKCVEENRECGNNSNLKGYTLIMCLVQGRKECFGGCGCPYFQLPCSDYALLQIRHSFRLKRLTCKVSWQTDQRWKQLQLN